MKRICKDSRFGLLIALASVLGIFAVCASAQEKVATGVPEREPPEYSIEHLVVGTGVENLEPVGAGESFPTSTEKIYCFVEANNIVSDAEIHVVWFHGEKQMLDTPLALKAGPRWRTYAYKRLYGITGDWRVEIKNAKGDIAKSLTFRVE